MDEFAYDALQYIAELKVQQIHSEDIEEWENLQEEIEEIEDSLLPVFDHL